MMGVAPMATFGHNVRAVMERKGIKAVEIAAAFGVSSQQADRYADPAYNNPTLETVFRLAKFLDVSIESLCEGIDPDYDAMRLRHPAPARLLDVWARVDPVQQQAMWHLLLSLAGAPTPDSTPADDAEAEDPPSRPAPRADPTPVER